VSAALFLMRLVGGAAFAIHGWGKLEHPWSWMGPNAPFPGFLQILATAAEFLGGIAWILGIGTPIASLAIGATMAVAVLTLLFAWNAPFVSPTGELSYEQASAYLCTALLLLTLGPGRLSLDRQLFGERTRES
jgi:putative oxidoreductase